MSLIKKIYLGFFFLLILLLSILVFLLSTDSGINIVVSRAAKWITGLEIACVSGNWRDLTINKLSYQMPGINIKVDELHFALELNRLWKHQLHFKEISARNVDIDINIIKFKYFFASKRTLSKNNSFNINMFNRYRQILVHKLAINHIVTKVNNASIIILDQIHTGFHIENHHITVTPTFATNVVIMLPNIKEQLPNKLITYNTKIFTKLIKRQINTNSIKKMVCSNLTLINRLHKLFKSLIISMPSYSAVDLSQCHLIIDSIEIKNLLISNKYRLFINKLKFQMSSNDKYLQLKTLSIESPQGTLSAFGAINLYRKGWPIFFKINVIANNSTIQGEEIKLTVDGFLQDKLCVKFYCSGPFDAQLILKTNLTQIYMPLTLKFYSRLIKWPLRGTSKYHLNNLTIRLNGDSTDYQLALKASLNIHKFPSTYISLYVNSNNINKFTLLNLHILALHGVANINTKLNWQHSVSWSSKLYLKGINTILQWPSLPTQLSGTLVSYGNFDNDKWQIKISECNLYGYIKQHILSIKGSLMGDSNGKWYIPKLIFTLGHNNIIIRGKLNNNVLLYTTFDAPQLSALIPNLKSGMASGDLRIRSNLNNSLLIMNIIADEISWDNIYIGHAVLKSNINSNNVINSNIYLKLDNFIHKSLSISQLIMSICGSSTRHRIALIVRSTLATGNLQLNGSFDQQYQNWYSVIDQANFNTPIGEWQLLHSLTIRYCIYTKNLFISPHCWNNPDAQICILHNNKVGSLEHINILLSYCNLSILSSLLQIKTSSSISGIVTGKIDLYWDIRDNLPRIKVMLAGRDIQIYQNVIDKKLQVVFKKLTFNSLIGEKLIYTSWLISTYGNGNLNGQIKIKTISNKPTLSGYISIDHFSLTIFKLLMPHYKGIDGLVNAKLHINGHVQQPRLYGEVNVQHLTIKDSFIPFTITDGNLSILFSNVYSTIKGSINTNQGYINLTGNADWSKMPVWHLRINADGYKVRMMISSAVQLDISPNIVLEASPKQLVLYGTARIPWARIEVKEMPKSVVNVSSDEAILDDNLYPAVNKNKNKYSYVASNLIIYIGNDVQFNAFGLKSLLKGNLKVVKNKQELELNGQINIISGRFHAYGQDLIINKGQLLFSGPAYQPYLNIEAIHNPDDIKNNNTLGIRITGLVDQPKIEVFSDSVQSQQLTPFYLLSRQEPDIANINNNMITSILIGMGVAKSGQVIGKIGQVLGVSELALDTQGAGYNSQVVVSGYIAPNLRIKYGIGIFDSVATLTVRYRLMPKLYLEAVSGLNQVLEMIYRFDF